MDGIAEPITKTESAKTMSAFLSTVFSTDEASKTAVLNAMQYALLSLMPSYLLLRMLRSHVPAPDDTKGSFEIGLEIGLQLCVMVVVMYLVNKAIIYIPTLSGAAYAEHFCSTAMILPFVVLLLTMQTKLGDKVDILYERAHGRGPRIVERMENPPAQEDTFLPKVGGGTGYPDFNSMHTAGQNNKPGTNDFPSQVSASGEATIARALGENGSPQAPMLPEPVGLGGGWGSVF